MSADCPGCWPTPKLPLTRVQADLVIAHPVTITYITTGLGGQSRRIDLPEPLPLEAGTYSVNVDADDVVTIERTNSVIA